MASYSYIESSGLILPDTAELKAQVEAEFKEALGQDLVITPESPEGVLIAVETEARDSVVRHNAELANQINPEYAGGIFLDAIAGLTGLEREGERHSMVQGHLAGVPGAIIPAGARAGTKAGDAFISRTNVVFNSEGHGEAWFYAEEPGAVPAPAGSLTVILKPELGWESISNPDAAILGRQAESDAVFRKKRDDTLYLQGVALTGAICSGVRAVPGVRSLAFRENYESMAKEIDGVMMPPHCVYAVVDGGEDADVAMAMFTKKSLGCGWKGRVEQEVTCPESGQKYTVRFDRPELVPVRAKVFYRVLGRAGIDCDRVIRQAIMSYADDQLERLRGFLVGAPVSPFDMTAAVHQVEPAIFVMRLDVGPLSAPDAQLRAETIHLALWQKAVITQGSIDTVAV